jgi:predicted ArsR family transcriptional regulator
MKVVKIRDISRRQARTEILEYLEKRERAWASEIADALRLDLSLVNRTLEELWREKKVEPTTQQVHRK